MFRKKYARDYKQEIRTELLKLLSDERLLLRYRNYERLIDKITKITTFKFDAPITVSNKDYKYSLTCDRWLTISGITNSYHYHVHLRPEDLCHVYIEKHLETFIKLYTKSLKNQNKER